MTQAHATRKGAVGLELDEKGSKEMIDAPMLKQVTNRSIYPVVHLTYYDPGGEDNSGSAGCRPSYSNNTLT
jgi:hypothetical protein